MKVLDIEILEWPDALLHSLGSLNPETHQPVIETLMDDGLMRREKSSPIPIFKGTVTMSELDRSLLNEFYKASHGRHFSFVDPQTKATVYATFAQPPRDHRTTIQVGSHTTYEVEIVLVNTTSLIEGAIAFERAER